MIKDFCALKKCHKIIYMPYKTHPVTYKGLNEWFEAMFEKLGWMILAKHYGDDLKIQEYKESLDHLRGALEAKMAATKSDHHKEDLEIMHNNLMILIEHVNEDFPPISQQGGGLGNFIVTKNDKNETEVLCKGKKCVKSYIIDLFKFMEKNLGKQKVSSPMNVFAQNIKEEDMKLKVVSEVSFERVMELVEKFNEEEDETNAEIEEMLKGKAKTTTKNPYLDDEE
jgi:hypothetical protein